MKKKIIKIIVSAKVYPLEAVYSACYVFIDRAYVYLSLSKEGDFIVRLTAKENTSMKQFSEIAGEFQNELLNATLRVVLAKNNKKIRQNIVERALFSSVGEDEIWMNDEVSGSIEK